MHCICTRL